MSQGTVKFFNANKGYGFIKPDDGGRDVFVHISALADGVDALPDDTRVEFETVPSKKEGKGPEAQNVQVIA